jgi:replicative DNA helicase
MGYKALNENRMKEFVDEFEQKIFPTIEGKDGEGVNRLEKIVEEKREQVLNRKKMKA